MTATIILGGLILLYAAIVAVWKIREIKKGNFCSGCGGNCSGCKSKKSK